MTDKSTKSKISRAWSDIPDPITDAVTFAGEVEHAMLSEREDGSTPLSDFLDKMTEAAVDDGSMACEYEQCIQHGDTAPAETWAAHPDEEQG